MLILLMRNLKFNGLEMNKCGSQAQLRFVCLFSFSRLSQGGKGRHFQPGARRLVFRVVFLPCDRKNIHFLLDLPPEESKLRVVL